MNRGTWSKKAAATVLLSFGLLLSGCSDDSDDDDAANGSSESSTSGPAYGFVDHGGQALVVDASYGPTASATEREALSSMVESLELVATT